MRRKQVQKPVALPPAPFVFSNPFRFGGTKALAALKVGNGYLCLEFQLGEVHLDEDGQTRTGLVVLFAAKAKEFESKRYIRTDDEVPEFVEALKAQAMTRGATLEAIQLLGELAPLTNEEEAVMAAEKLTRKPAKADKEALKNAAKEAPVGGKKAKAAKPEAAEEAAPKKRGNAEALAAAREAKAAAGPDKRKITIADKKNPFRDGSNRAEAWGKITRAKTVQDYLDNGGPSKYVKRWADEGKITLA